MTEIKDTDLMMITAGGGKSLLNLKMLESTPYVKKMMQKVNNVNNSAVAGKQHFKKYTK